MKRFSLALVSLFGLVASAFAQTSYNRFGPANGVLVGDSSTFYTSAADSSDIIGLWSGTCNLSSFLRGDGTCAAPTITGQALTRVDDTNVTLTLGGSPSTALVNPASLTLGWTGQLAPSRGGTGVSALGDLTRVNDTNVTLTLGGTPTGSLINSTSLTLGWTGQLAVSRGGTGASSLSGLLTGNGTSPISGATSSDVIAEWTGTCNSTTFLRADGTCQTVGSGSGSVTSISAGTGISNSPNPITTTGTISVDQAFTPTWTGVHQFTRAGGTQAIFSGSAASSSYITMSTSGTPYGYVGEGAAIMSSANGIAIGGINRVQLATGDSASATRVDIDNTNITASLPIVGTTATFSGAVRGGGQFEYGSGVSGFMETVNRSAGALGYKVYLGAAGTAPTISWDSSGNLTNPGTGSFTTVSATTGTFTNATVGGSNVCRADGTNCPASTGPTTVFKSSATDRSSTTALATDPDLVFTSAASAVYKVEFCLVFGGVSTGTQGFKFAFNKTAAGTDPGMWGGFSIVNSSAATHSGTRLGLGTGDTGGQIAFTTISVGNQQDTVCGSGSVVTNGTSQYGIQWAQNSSSANATRLGQGSFIQYQRIN